MAKKDKETQYIMSSLNTQMLNYKIYVMNLNEKIITFACAFILGATVGLTFYGGLFRDADGITTNATLISNIVVMVSFGMIGCLIVFPVRCKQLKDKRKKELRLQFRSFLESLAISLSSGNNMTDSLISSAKDLKIQYSENAYIVTEINEILAGIQNNIAIEDMLKSLGERSQIEDIKNFGVVFETCHRAGGNMKDVVRRTSDIIGEKIEIEAEIDTKLTSNKTQFMAMMVVPVILMIMFRLMSTTFAAGFATFTGVVAITIAIFIFICSFLLGQKILNVKE